MNSEINRMTHTKEDIYMMLLLSRIVKRIIELQLITYDDLASKVNNINPNPILKTASMEKKNKGSVKFSQGIKAGPSSSKIVNKSVNKNKSNKNFNKSKTDNKNDSEKKLPCVNIITLKIV